MTAYKCLRCNCIHGWSDHPGVKEVTSHIRYPGEDVWWCPRCGREHRTTDGTLFGQLHKLWEKVDPDEQQEEYIVIGNEIIYLGGFDED
jgi:hypothetical protein